MGVNTGNKFSKLRQDKQLVPGKFCLIKCESISKTSETFYLIDYASAGRDWDTAIAAWLSA